MNNTQTLYPYKNILWIDDIDDSQASNSDIRYQNMLSRKLARKNISTETTEIKDYNFTIKEYFGIRKKECIYLIDDVSSAIKMIIGDNKNSLKYEYNIYDFDLIIFDIDMTHDISIGKDGYTPEFKEQFESNGVFLPDNYEDFLRLCGVYLYMLLLNIGYPKNRMICLTANTVENSIKEFKNKSINAAVLEKIKQDSDWLEDWYSKNEYYKIRRFIYQSCNYWKEQLNNIASDSEITFNRLYELNTPKGTFISMLERIKMLFPVTIPVKPEEVYYQAMHTLSMFHDESAIFDKLKSRKLFIQQYHQVIRNFRNWSSHNKFNTNSICGDLFVLLTCIALRTYFDRKREDDYSFSDQLFLYENNYYLNYSSLSEKEYDSVVSRNKIQAYFETILNSIEVYGEKKAQGELLKKLDLHSVLQRLGFQDYPLPPQYILLSLFKSPIYYELKNSKIMNVKKQINSAINNGVFNPKINFEYEKCTENIVDTYMYQSIDRFFRIKAFNLL